MNAKEILNLSMRKINLGLGPILRKLTSHGRRFLRTGFSSSRSPKEIDYWHQFFRNEKQKSK